MSEQLRRKLSLRLYPTPKQEALLTAWMDLHRELYNAALQERIDCYRKTGQTITYYDQQNVLPQIKVDRPDLVPLGSHALQETLRRLDRAFQAFFRRVKNGETPGFPRFKGRSRFKSFSYPDPAGWSWVDFPSKSGRNARTSVLRFGGMTIRARGMCRFDRFEPNDLTIQRVGAHWEASMTLRVNPADAARERTGAQIRAFDQGINDRLVFDDGESFDNPRWLREQLAVLESLQRDRSRCKRGSRGYHRLTIRIARCHRGIANRRRDWLHKRSSALVARCEVLATEKLDAANMSRAPKPKEDPSQPGHYLPNGAAAKAGLNRENLSAGYAAFLKMCAYKAEEAGTRFHITETRQVKPSQRCACCGATAPKALEERIHRCEKCGFTTGRDRNAALVMLIDAMSPGYWAALDRARKKKATAADLARVSLGSYSAFLRNRVAYAQGEIDHASSQRELAGERSVPCFTAPGTGVVTDLRGACESTMLLGTGNPTLVP